MRVYAYLSLGYMIENLYFYSIMSKIFKVMLIGAYGALFVQYLKITLLGRTDDVIELEYEFRQPGSLKKILRDVKKHGANVTLRRLIRNFKRPERLPTDFKYILKWSEPFSHYISASFPNGQAAFLENKCEYTNCFMTADKSLLPDRRYFDAVLFDVENVWDDHPIIRAPHQYYIFTASEPAKNYPICHSHFESYYNLTWTYKLDSDIRWSHITILDKSGKIVGPKVDMTWIDPMEPPSETVVRRFVHKRKVAAWFVSNCRTKSKREKIATQLSAALAKYNLKIDIYGWCGELTCSKDHFEECLDLLEQDYYFYLAFENSLSEDYVTEKLLYSLRHFTVPIVYGGANYSRFIPPGAYLDASKLNATELAFRMNEAMKKPAVYQNYFRWHNYYTYKESTGVPDVCSLCKLLNDPSIGHRTVKGFRQWWLPNYKKECAEEEKRMLLQRQ